MKTFLKTFVDVSIIHYQNKLHI